MKPPLVDIDSLAGHRAYERYARMCLRIAIKTPELLSEKEKDEYRRMGGVIPLRPNFAQMRVQAAIESCLHRGLPPRVVCLKHRQVGISTDAEGRLFHDCHLSPNRSGIVIAHKRDSAQKIFKMCERFYNNLPPSMHVEKKHFTKNQIEFDNGSELRVEVATEGAGRGFTAQRIHLSEIAQYPDIARTLDAVNGAVPPSADSLVVAESTPFGLNGFHELYVQAKSGDSDFVPVFVAWHEDPTCQRIPDFTQEELTEEEREQQHRFGLGLAQIAWRRWVIRNMYRGVLESFLQEMPSDDRSCFLVSGRPLFDGPTLDYYGSMVPPHVALESLPPACEITWDDQKREAKIHEFGQGPLRIYQPPVARHRYVVGVDPSEGDLGSDPSPCVVMDQMTLEPVAVWHGRRRPDRLAHTARALCAYYNQAHCIWEANNHGLAFQIEFEKLWGDYYMRETSMGSVARRVSNKPGFQTSTATRHLLFDVLRQLAEERLAPIRDPGIVAEMGWVFYDERNQVQVRPGKTKDRLVAYALCLEAHRGDPENVLEPLSVEDRGFVVAELRKAKVASSMGIVYTPEVSRLSMTAEEVEEMDAQDDKEQRRANVLGIGAPL